MERRDTVVLYHKHCPDGFGAAYAAWKKFGNTAEYIPVGYGDPVVHGLEGREVFMVDFCYELPGEVELLARITRRFVVLDHHKGARERVLSVPEHVFDETRSGATIAWNYFHPDEPLPRFLQVIQDGDLYTFALPETRQMRAYISIMPHDFLLWDKTVAEFEQPTKRASIIKKAAHYYEYYNALIRLSVDSAKRIRFEGYTCYFATTHPSMRSEVAHELCMKLPPLALVVNAHPDGLGVSVRGDGSIDVSKIAEKYNGGGHASSAGFFIRNGIEMPWVELED